MNLAQHRKKCPHSDMPRSYMKGTLYECPRCGLEFICVGDHYVWIHTLGTNDRERLLAHARFAAGRSLFQEARARLARPQIENN